MIMNDCQGWALGGGALMLRKREDGRATGINPTEHGYPNEVYPIKKYSVFASSGATHRMSLDRGSDASDIA